jgi:integrase/recombinase XerD
MSDSPASHEKWLSLLKDHLEKERYSSKTARHWISEASKFLTFVAKQRLAIDAAQPKTVAHYLRLAKRTYRRHHGHSPDYEGWRCSHTSGIHMLLRLIHGQWPPVPLAVTPSEIFQRETCDAYALSLFELRGLAPETVSGCRDEAGRFLEWLGQRACHEAVALLTVADVDSFMRNRAGSLRRPSLKRIATQLRGFLRWLHATARTTRDLSTVVMAPTLYAFETIPSALRSEDVNRILTAAAQDSTPKGVRDYAILTLLARYGTRAGEITALRLDDVDWRKDSIRIRHTKTGVTSYLPLLPEVGEAILRYLQQGRQKTSFREIFIRSRAPYRPFVSGSSLYTSIRRRIDAAGVVTAGKRGPHAFRHARAVSMLRATATLKEIGDVLGHRASDSTLVYLKLATEDLRRISLEVPAEVKA